MITENTLLEWNRLGLIPGPNESDDDYEARALHCLQLRQMLIDSHCNDLPEIANALDANGVLQEAYEITRPLFDVEPSWVPFSFSNYQLSLWHGGCTWIFRLHEKDPLSCLLQVRKTFLKKERYLLLFHRKELIAHEIAHIGRMAYEEPYFEEVLAYRTATSFFSKAFGGILSSVWEVFSLIFFVCVLIFADMISLVTDNFYWYELLFPLKVLPLLFVCFAFFRLLWRKHQVEKCLQLLKKAASSESAANAILFRLTDKEIITFSSCSEKVFFDYMKEMATSNLRWRIINQAYFHRKSAI